MGNLDENGNLNVNIEKKAINGIQRTGISCVAGPSGLSECVRNARDEMETVSENSISLHGYFFGNIKAVTHFTD
jgi:hypothetical protein